jgi:hypothetical protein
MDAYATGTEDIIKDHQDGHNQWDERDICVKINVLTDRQARATYQTRWVPGIGATLFHGAKQVTKRIPVYIHHAKHTPDRKRYLIQCSTRRHQDMTNHGMKQVPTRPLIGDIMVKHSRSYAMEAGSRSPSIPTTYFRPYEGYKQSTIQPLDRQCFDCNQLWEDTTHVLTCSCDASCVARKIARNIFQQKLRQMHTVTQYHELL